MSPSPSFVHLLSLLPPPSTALGLSGRSPLPALHSSFQMIVYPMFINPFPPFRSLSFQLYFMPRYHFTHAPQGSSKTPAPSLASSRSSVLSPSSFLSPSSPMLFVVGAPRSSIARLRRLQPKPLVPLLLSLTTTTIPTIVSPRADRRATCVR